LLPRVRRQVSHVAGHVSFVSQVISAVADEVTLLGGPSALRVE
jgi:hypothetical protein